MTNKVFIFSGCYGSGKTEVSTNFAIDIKNEDNKVAIADMDVVNPYFRSRDKYDLFEEKNIKLIAPPKNLNKIDLPVLTAEIGGYIDQKNYKVILDLGGDDLGTTPLGSLRNKIKNKVEFEMYLVVNVNRPFTEDVDGILKMAHMVEKVSGLKVTSLISNTHMKTETSKDMIIDGAEKVKKASEKLSVDMDYITIPEFLYDSDFVENLKDDYEVDVMELNLYYKTPWA